MIPSREINFEQDNPVPNGTVCTALYDARPEYHTDLDFKKGEKIVIVEPCNVLFFYIGRNEEGKEGVIPINYFTFDSSSGGSSDRTESQPAHSYFPLPEVPGVPQSPSVDPKTSGSPVQARRTVVARGSSTLPVGSSLSGQDDANQARTNVVDDIDRRPPCPLPPEATNPVNPMVATDNFKKTSGWFKPNIQQVWRSCIYHVEPKMWSMLYSCAIYSRHF